jgi:hypothetical protein
VLCLPPERVAVSENDLMGQTFLDRQVVAENQILRPTFAAFNS